LKRGQQQAPQAINASSAVKVAGSPPGKAWGESWGWPENNPQLRRHAAAVDNPCGAVTDFASHVHQPIVNAPAPTGRITDALTSHFSTLDYIDFMKSAFGIRYTGCRSPSISPRSATQGYR
jgi:hypothetical protein